VRESSKSVDFDNLPEEPVNMRRYYDEWLAAMSDDFNTPLAIASLFEMLKDINSYLASGDHVTPDFGGVALLFLKRLAGDVLGILPSESQDLSSVKLEGKLIETLIRLRVDARKNKDFKAADLIRVDLQKLGVILEDKKDGSTSYKVLK
jgi:cysteinyl-tRNA synthetase